MTAPKRRPRTPSAKIAYADTSTLSSLSFRRAMGKRIQLARIMLSTAQNHSVRQIDIARKLRMGQSAISKYEMGEQEPSLERMVQLASVLRVEPCYLAFGLPHGKSKELKSVLDVLAKHGKR